MGRKTGTRGGVRVVAQGRQVQERALLQRPKPPLLWDSRNLLLPSLSLLTPSCLRWILSHGSWNCFVIRLPTFPGQLICYTYLNPKVWGGSRQLCKCTDALSMGGGETERNRQGTHTQAHPITPASGTVLWLWPGQELFHIHSDVEYWT